MLFSVFRQTPRYYSKNFYKEIGLSPHFTLKGFLLRVQRRYPILYRFTKFTFVFMTIATTSMVLFSGSSLPLQREIKQTAIRGFERFGRLWYLGESQNSNGHNIISYIDFIYQIIWYAFDNGLENSQVLSYYLKLVNDAVENSILSIKKSSQRCSVSSNQISSSILLINKLFYILNNSQMSYLKKQTLQILKNQSFLFEYSRVLNNIVESNHRQTSEIEEKYKKTYQNLFKIFEYLLKFSRPEQKITILEKMNKMLAQNRFKFMCDALVEGEDSLKSELKKLYVEEESCKAQIMSIIKIVEENRRQKEEKQKKK